MNLLYTKKDKRLFWIAGYTKDGNTYNVIKQTTHLMEYALEFATEVGCSIDEVKTYFVAESESHRNMRVFFIKTENVPEQAKVLHITYDLPIDEVVSEIKNMYMMWLSRRNLEIADYGIS